METGPSGLIRRLRGRSVIQSRQGNLRQEEQL